MSEKRRSRGGVYVFSPIKRVLLIIVLFVLAFMAYISFGVFNEKNAEYNMKNQIAKGLEESISEEESKVAKLKKSDNQVTTNEEIESIARQELGLIKRDEIVIKPN